MIYVIFLLDLIWQRNKDFVVLEVDERWVWIDGLGHELGVVVKHLFLRFRGVHDVVGINDIELASDGFLQYVVDALKKETEQIAEREAENRKQQIFAQIEARKDAVVNFYIEYQAREKRLEEYEKQYKSDVAELKRRLRAGSIGNKGYQKAFTPLRKKMEQMRFDLDHFKVKSINEIFERGDSISDGGYFEYIKDFLKAK